MERPTRLTASRIIGLDLSKKTLVGCTLTEKDGFQRKRFFSGQMNAAGRSKLASTLGSTDAVFMEGGSSSFTLARYLLNHTESQVFVLNPMQLHIIFESMCKTDKQDAAKIAKYARDAHPENWVLIPIPTKEESAERSIVKLHIAYSHLGTKVVNKLHAVFNGQGHPDLKKSNLKDPDLRRVWAGTLLTDESASFCADLLMDQLDCIEAQLACIRERIRHICLSHPKQARSWLSIPGIGDISAATLIAFIGDGQRFSSANQLRNYIGLIPKKDQSGKVDKQLGVAKHGCMPIRRHIMQGAWGIKRFSKECSLTRYWKELESRGKIGQKASVAIANKMVSIGFALLKNGELYRMPDHQRYFEQKLRLYKLEALIGNPSTTIDADESSTTS